MLIYWFLPMILFLGTSILMVLEISKSKDLYTILYTDINILIKDNQKS